MTGTLFGIALNVVMALELVTGMPIAVTERTDHPYEFRDLASNALCEKTGDIFCATDLDFIERTTAYEGLSVAMNYLGTDGQNKAVCLLLPPSPGFTPSYASTQLSAGQYYAYEDLPSQDELSAWLLMHWAARCLDQEGGPGEEQRADAFASMALALMQGDPIFTRYPLDTPARKFAFFRNRSTSEQAVDLAERHMLEIWKLEAAQALQQEGCQAQAAPSQEPRVSRIPRESQLPACYQRNEQAMDGYPFFPGTGFPGTPGLGAPSYISAGLVPVSDSNLHMWMYGETANQIQRKENENGRANPTTGAPPRPWSPFKGFSSTQEAVSYIWAASSSIANLSY